MSICLKCGAANEESNHCGQCGAKLSKLSTSISGQATFTRQRIKYELLKTQLQQLETGELTWEAFASWYAGFCDEVAAGMHYLIECIQQSHGPGWSYVDEFPEEAEATFAGLELYESALNQFGQAIEEENLPGAQAALATFLQGSERFNDALAFNAETQRSGWFDGWGFT